MKYILCLALLTSCAIGPTYRRPQVATPCTFECNDNRSEPWVCWWKELNDPQLDCLIQRALSCNFDLKIATSKAQTLRGKYIMTQSLLWPWMNAGFNPARWELSNDFPFLTVSDQFNTFDLFFDASWEIDLFGKNRRLAQASFANFQAQIEYAKHVKISLISEMARTYIDLRSFQKQLANARETKQIQQDLYQLVADRVSQNISSEMQLSKAAQQLYKTEATIPILEKAIAESINGIALIVSELPGDLVCELSKSCALPTLPSCLPVGIPSSLLCRRPDILEAEKKLEAAVAQTGYSIADFFPVFDVTANLGYFSTQLGSLLSGANINKIFAGGILFPLFHGGELIGQYKAAKAEQCEALYNYASVVLKSFHDVDNAITAYRKEQDHYTMLQKVSMDQEANSKRMCALFEQGLEDKSEVLRQRLAQIEIENDEINSYTKRLNYFIALYKALGGGWESL